MTKEEKELLLRDLSARLPYGVIVDIKYNNEHGSSDRLRICSEGSLILNIDLIGLCIEEEIHLKPYLRPMSSITEEENKEYFSIWTGSIRGDMIAKIDFYIKHHFDFRLTSEGLSMIEAGLALEAPGGMYKIEEL